MLGNFADGNTALRERSLNRLEDSRRICTLTHLEHFLYANRSLELTLSNRHYNKKSMSMRQQCKN